MSKRTLALIAVSFAALFYGANYTIAKDVMPHYIKPFGFIVLRVLGAFLLFWIASFFGPKEKIDRKDFPKIALAALFGVGINMLAFFEGLNLTTPINASVLMVTTATATNPAMGNFLVFINAASYACYIIIVKKITQKYHPFTFIKWMYGIGFLFVLPFGLLQLMEVQPDAIPIEGYLKIGYVIVFATFGTYTLNIFGIRELKPTTVAVFIYVQPMLASIFAISLGKDKLDVIKIVATLLIFIGVYLVTKKPKT